MFEPGTKVKTNLCSECKLESPCQYKTEMGCPAGGHVFRAGETHTVKQTNEKGFVELMGVEGSWSLQRFSALAE